MCINIKLFSQITDENNCKTLSFLYYFEVEWTEFSHGLGLEIFKKTITFLTIFC